MSDTEPQGFAVIPRWLLHDVNVSMRAKLTYLGLSSHADRHGRSWPSHARLAAVLGISTSSVQRGITELLALGVVVRTERRRKSGAKSSNLYVLTSGAVDNPVDGPVDG